ncbi:MAG: very short patch repair endonuclease [Candidatus Latescibacterota bacterium]
MTDVFSKAERSGIMRKIKSKNTKPEMALRSALHKRGFRFRIHVADLPGKPDIVLPKYKTVIQVRGCFWHGHSCKAADLPASNREYWVKKVGRNRERDRVNDLRLSNLGWKVIIVWECEISSKVFLERKTADIEDTLISAKPQEPEIGRTD